MALVTPRALEEQWQGVLARVAKREVAPRALAVMVERLSRKYNGEDVAVARGDELLARLLFWFPRDVHKVALPIAELARARALPSRPLRVLDVGAGLGASSLGLLRALMDPALAGTSGATVATIDAVDTDAEALALLRKLAEAASSAGLLPKPLPELATRVGSLAEPAALRDPRGGGYDLVLLGSVLVEATRGLGDEQARGRAIAERIAAAVDAAPLARDGAVVVIEPATREETRALHHARAELLARGLGVFAPCTHADACPMLERARDWCHEDLPTDLPAWLAPVARDAGLRWQGLTFSYLVLRRDGPRSVGELVAAPGVVPARLVSTPRATKGKTEAVACGPFPGPSRGVRLMQLEREVRDARRAAEGEEEDAGLLGARARGDLVGVTEEAAQRAAEGRPVRVGLEELSGVSGSKAEGSR